MKDYVDYDWHFPENENERIAYVKAIMQKRARLRNDGQTIRILSSVQRNLSCLQKELKIHYDLQSHVARRVNGIGTKYFELTLYKKEQIDFVAKKDLLSSKENAKWLLLKK